VATINWILKSIELAESPSDRCYTTMNYRTPAILPENYQPVGEL
jgi:hypothetical protein